MNLTACVINTVGDPRHYRWDQQSPAAGVRQRSATKNMNRKFEVAIKEIARSRHEVKGLASDKQHEHQ